MVKKANIAGISRLLCLVLAVASIWFTLGFRSGKVYLKVGAWEHLMYKGHATLLHSEYMSTTTVAEASDDSSDSNDTEFA